MTRGKWTIISMEGILPMFCLILIGLNYLNNQVMLSRLRLPLDPQYFDVKVVAKEDVLKLDHAADHRHGYFNPAAIAEMYTPIGDGSQYVLVTMKGMSYAASQSRMVIGSIFLVSLLALVGQLVNWRPKNNAIRAAAVTQVHD